MIYIETTGFNVGCTNIGKKRKDLQNKIIAKSME